MLEILRSAQDDIRGETAAFEKIDSPYQGGGQGEVGISREQRGLPPPLPLLGREGEPEAPRLVLQLRRQFNSAPEHAIRVA